MKQNRKNLQKLIHIFHRPILFVASSLKCTVVKLIRCVHHDDETSEMRIETKPIRLQRRSTLCMNKIIPLFLSPINLNNKRLLSLTILSRAFCVLNGQERGRGEERVITFEQDHLALKTLKVHREHHKKVI